MIRLLKSFMLKVESQYHAGVPVALCEAFQAHENDAGACDLLLFLCFFMHLQF